MISAKVKAVNIDTNAAEDFLALIIIETKLSYPARIAYVSEGVLYTKKRDVKPYLPSKRLPNW